MRQAMAGFDGIEREGREGQRRRGDEVGGDGAMRLVVTGFVELR